MSNTEGVWAQGWTADGKRVAAWHHRSGAVWAWNLEAGLLLQVRPVSNGDSKPPGHGTTGEWRPDIPYELREWVVQ